MRQVKSQLIVALLASLITFVAASVWQGVTDGGLLRLLGGVAASDFRTAIKTLEAREPLDVVQTTIVIRTPEHPDTDADGSAIWPGRPTYVAPRVPADPDTYRLDLRCPSETEIVAAWREVGTSHPGLDDQFYTVDAGVDRESGTVQLALRSRGDRSRTAAYAYVEVYALCRAVG